MLIDLSQYYIGASDLTPVERDFNQLLLHRLEQKVDDKGKAKGKGKGKEQIVLTPLSPDELFPFDIEVDIIEDDVDSAAEAKGLWNDVFAEHERNYKAGINTQF